MKTFDSSHPIPAWQIERAKKLHRACLSLQAALARGEKMCQAHRRVARSFNGRKFKSNPARRTKLCAGSLRRLFKVWKRGGEMPSALIIKYSHRPPSFPALPLVRFVEFCSDRPQPNMKAAWKSFQGRGTGKASGSQKISLQQVYYFFPAADFRRMQACLKASKTALLNAAGLRFKVIAEIRRRVPDRAVKPRVQRADDFEI